MNIYDNISDFLKNNKDENINFCVANNAISEMVINLMISAKSNNVKLVLFALDNEIIHSCKDYCDIVKYLNNNEKVIENQYYKFGTESFRDVVFQRFFIGNEILKANKSYIYLDVDIVIIKNFVNNILNQFENTNYDCLTQFNGKHSNTGVVAMIPNKKTINVDYNFFKKHNYLDKNLFDHDQNFFNRIILKNKILNVKWLSRNDYPNGKWYYENTKEVDKHCFLIHFNCIIGYDTKVNKMKEYKKWYISDL